LVNFAFFRPEIARKSVFLRKFKLRLDRYGPSNGVKATASEDHPMWKKVVVASAALAIAGTSFVYAQRFGGPDGPGGMRGFDRFRPSADDLSAFVDARIAAMKAGLRLMPEQEKNWPAFENAYRNLAKMRTDRMTAMRDGAQQPPADLPERLQRRADAMSNGAAAFKQVADATVPLYRSLDDAQKRRFTVLARILRPMQGRHGGGPERRGFRPDGNGPGQFQRGGLDRTRVGDGGALERIHFSDRLLNRRLDSNGADEPAASGAGDERR
jgi:zinc resistance-associated protein